MKSNTFLTVVITFVLTSLMWAVVYHVLSSRTDSGEKMELLDDDCMVAGDGPAINIIGVWEPIEVAQHKIEVSKYGILKVYNGSSVEQYEYEVYENHVSYGITGSFNAKISSDESGNTYLEIYNNVRLAGKYKKIRD